MLIVPEYSQFHAIYVLACGPSLHSSQVNLTDLTSRYYSHKAICCMYYVLSWYLVLEKCLYFLQSLCKVIPKYSYVIRNILLTLDFKMHLLYVEHVYSMQFNRK